MHYDCSACCLFHASFSLDLLFNLEYAGYMFSETSVYFYRSTRWYIPGGRSLHNRRCVNLKSYKGNHVEVWLTDFLFCSDESLFLNINIFRDVVPCVLVDSHLISLSPYQNCIPCASRQEVTAWIGPTYTQKMKVICSCETLVRMGWGLTSMTWSSHSVQRKSFA
jgi:predicted Fe-S protein YdhL (DUF1289 family)